LRLAKVGEKAYVCGIAGFVGQGTRDHLEKMVQTLVHRGPDDQGLFLAPGIGLGMCRLSIIDIAGGHQPMSSEEDSLSGAMRQAHRS